MRAFEKDILLIRELAKKIEEISQLPEQQVKKRQWIKLNRLQPERPMFTIDQICWHELNVNDELTLRCEHPFYREIEMTLRRLLYRYHHLKDDYVFEPYLYIPTTVVGLNHGLQKEEDVLVLNEDKEAIQAHHFHDQLETEEDLEKIQVPEFYIDEEKTQKDQEMAQEACGDILEVIMDGVDFGFDMWDMIVEWRGFDNLFMDMAADPEFILKIVDKATEVHLQILNKLEAMNLLMKHRQRIHCSGAYTDELNCEDPLHPRAAESWTYGMAQILYNVSPEMHNEFEFKNAEKWYSRFGLAYYGCCEPLDDRLEYVKQIPNIRKISCSPWVKNYERFAEELEGNYVMSHKPAPAFLVDGRWNPEKIRENLEMLLNASRKYDCPCEFLLKDISTVSGKPERLWQWSEMMRGIIME